MASYWQHQKSALCFVLGDQAQGRETQLGVGAFCVEVETETDVIRLTTGTKLKY